MSKVTKENTNLSPIALNLVDTHVHLNSSKFRNNLDEIIKNANNSGVTKLITIGCDLEDSKENLALSEKFSCVFPTVGIHPIYVNKLKDSWLDELSILASDEKVSAIGEIGLDYFHSPKDNISEEGWKKKQFDVFENQLDLALKLDLPVVIHQRESKNDCIDVLKNHPKVKAVFHCFNGNPYQLETLLEMGHFVSFTGIITFKNAQEVRDIAKITPIERIMVETDCPYLAPEPYRGKTCEPYMVKYVADCISKLHGLSLEEFAEITTKTANLFFKNLSK